ncbi:hypothetical protein TIFTF001_011675 [Ficus carica]|uniref:Uncharacterized protein n=1 Tax=Ficus carica TaxID=3494 RepID=A0AA88A0B7_FICCA|nr:hypothetical protein TIFTF001_011675 [Ficus carica]
MLGRTSTGPPLGECHMPLQSGGGGHKYGLVLVQVVSTVLVRLDGESRHQDRDKDSTGQHGKESTWPTSQARASCGQGSAALTSTMGPDCDLLGVHEREPTRGPVVHRMRWGTWGRILGNRLTWSGRIFPIIRSSTLSVKFGPFVLAHLVHR